MSIFFIQGKNFNIEFILMLNISKNTVVVHEGNATLPFLLVEHY